MIYSQSFFLSRPQGGLFQVQFPRRVQASLFWQTVALLLWLYLLIRRFPQIHFGGEDGVECTQNLFTLAERYRYTRSVAHWLPK